MKIAVVAPPFLPVPPPKYGGIELVVYNLVEGLTDLGEEVTLFGPRESKVSCRLMPYIETLHPFGPDSPEDDRFFVAELATKYAFAHAGYEKFDIIHDHTLSRSPVELPTVHTVHSSVADETVRRCIELASEPCNHFVAVSERQRELFMTLSEEFHFEAVVHHGIDVDSMEWGADKQEFFLFAGRCNWEKGIDVAVRVAGGCGAGLVFALKMGDPQEKEYFLQVVQPLMGEFARRSRLFNFYEEIPRSLLLDLFKRAKATLFVPQWEEPFGLVMIESMACGTPILALRRGAAPEVVVDGVTGFLADSEKELISLAGRLGTIDPADCRRHVQANFSRLRMAQDYRDVYRRVLAGCDPLCLPQAQGEDRP